MKIKTYLFILFKNMMNIFRAIFRTLTKIDDGAFYDNTQQFYVLLTVFTKGLHPLMMKIIISKLVVLILLFAISTYKLHHLISSRTHCLQSFPRHQQGIQNLVKHQRWSPFANIVNSITLLNIFEKYSLIDDCRSSEYASEYVQHV